MKEIYVEHNNMWQFTVYEATQSIVCAKCDGTIGSGEYMRISSCTHNAYCLKCDEQIFEHKRHLVQNCVQAWKKYKRTKKLEEIKTNERNIHH